MKRMYPNKPFTTKNNKVIKMIDNEVNEMISIKVMNTETGEMVYDGSIPWMGLIDVPLYCIRDLNLGLTLKNIRVLIEL